LANAISKIASAPAGIAHAKANDSSSAPPAANNQKSANASVPPSYSTSAMAVSGSVDTSNLGISERQLKRQGLECLVVLLKSLVSWGTSSDKSAADSGTTSARPYSTDDPRQGPLTPDPSSDRLSIGTSSESVRQPTPTIEAIDDPTRFESAKQRKTTLLEGIRKFNQKAKRVGSAFYGRL
jgi:brefeldin A-inhibited guanine nucleotide-exchange protein